MLNYRPSKRLGVSVIGEDSAHLYRMLVEEGKKMSFVGLPDPTSPSHVQPELMELPDHGDEVSLTLHRQEAEEELDSFLENPVLPVGQMDAKLRTTDIESVLQAKLRTILREATLANEELGINTLFLTLGSLAWCETGDKPLRAPLIYVPVNLEKQANGTIKLSYDGSDIGANLPLRSKMQEFNLILPELNEEKPLLEYFSELGSTIRIRENWQVLPNEVCLSFFNYEKYSMYVDLGGEGWGEIKKPWLNPDIISMLGGGYVSPDSKIGEDTHLDKARPLGRSFEVYDADSSQLLAMIRADEGHSIVVEGPPGTGKSQTITNIIAEAVAHGKTVLFVSAKRAALDVVKRRLDEADLGAMCLDLHDKLTNRREFYQEIKRTADRTLSIRNEEAKLKRLADLRDRLNAHSDAINEPLNKYGIAPFEAMAILGQLPPEMPEDRGWRIPFETLRHWSHSDVKFRLHPIAALQARVGETGLPVEHPFWGASIEYLDPSKRLDLSEDLASAVPRFESAISLVAAVARTLQIEPPQTANDVPILRTVTEHSLCAPPHQGVAIRASSWFTEEAFVREVIHRLKERARLRTLRSTQVSTEIWQFDCSSIESTLNRYSEKWFKLLIGEFRNASSDLAPYLTAAGPKTPLERRDLVRDVRQVQKLESEIADSEHRMRSLFGVQWLGIDSDPVLVERLLEWILDILRKVDEKQLPPGILDLLSEPAFTADFLEQVDRAEQAVTSAMEAYERVCALLGYPTENRESASFTTLVSRLITWQKELGRLPQFISFNQARRQALASGLESVVEVADKWPSASTRLSTLFQRSYYTGVVREAMELRPELRSFERKSHEAAISEFQNLDDFKLKFNRAAVKLAHYRQMPNFDLKVGNLNLLRIQCELQRKHKPIRWILERAGEAIQKIKPVFMMSPLSVAIHLPPELPAFDMVIFDEASQVKPEDALCSIVRARQTIVVGDTRQMPPTSFFDRLVDDDDLDQEDDLSELGNEARKLESVLSLMNAVAIGSIRRPDLRWHYRSLHPALIQPSNEMFYGNRLVVFPSARVEENGRKIGLVFHHHPETVYESGSTKRVNRREAELVAQAVMVHVDSNTSESLLIAAMNKPQADLIFEEVQKLERQSPWPFQKFRAKHPHEPLSIKNLENVQGDERDVIFISVTYGRDVSGAIRQQFGPLLKDGGERRLNVLITRARRRCEVFSNMTSDDLRNDPPRAGVESLKRYLKFAQTGSIEVATLTGGKEESPFEEEVASALRDLGYAFDLQVGFEGFRIDLAVLDPVHPGSYILGVECDGATYHSARSARDRDKLRQRILENRGWKLHRIWSHDWWQDKAGEVARLIAAIEASHQSDDAPDTDPPEEVEFLIKETLRTTNPGRFTRPYVATSPPGVMTTKAELGSYMVQVVQTEGPIHEDLLRQRLRDAAGYGRSGKTVKALLDEVIRDSRRYVRFSVDSYCIDESQLRQPRDWSTVPTAEKKVEFVPEVEIAAALRHVVGNAFGVDESAAAKSALNLLGFKRITDSALARGIRVVNRMIDAGGIKRFDGLLYGPEKR